MADTTRALDSKSSEATQWKSAKLVWTTFI